MRPLIAMAGEFWNGATALGLADGFREAGFDVLTFDSRYYGLTTGRDPVLRILARLSNARANDVYRARIRADCTSARPDIFLSVKNAGADRAMLRAFRSTGVRTAMFYPDVSFSHAGVDPEIFELYDFIFTTKTFHLEWLRANLRGPNVHHIQHGYSTRTHRASASIAKSDLRHDVTFIGNHSAYKQDWLIKLMALRPDLDLTVVGPNWQKPTRGTALELKLIGELNGAAYRRLIAQSRINIALHHGPTDDGWSDDVSTRTFEIPAARGFMLHIENDEVRSLFDVGREIDTFSTPAELAEKINFYLAHPERRDAMIEAAFTRAVPDYSYDARAAEMTALMGFGASGTA